MTTLTAKERMQIKRIIMPEQPPVVRRHNFREVPYGLTAEMAITEANRCLNCKKQPCVAGCPVQVPIPEFIALVQQGKFAEAAQKIKEKNVLPAVCGRVCPQEDQCEVVCIHTKREGGVAVAIGNLERFVADYERINNTAPEPKICPKNGKKVAVVGSGPSGLTVAGDLIQTGYEVTVFEAFHRGGGVLVYGIPEFRLPKAIVEDEINNLAKLGVKFEYNSVIGRMATVDELLEDYDAVFLGVGAGLPSFMNIPGINLNGVYSANEYLTRSNLMKAYLFPDYSTPIMQGKNVVVVGGGNVAMDCARTAIRLEADNVYLVYRRAREQMPARVEEVHHADDEELEFKLLSNPVEILGDESGHVRAVKCQRYELGEPDESGRRRPIAIDNDYFELESDLVIIAIGQKANPLITSTTPDIETNQWGNIVTDEAGRTSKKFVYAGGDIVTGAATVISAMGAGRNAAKAINEDLFPDNTGSCPT